MTPLRTLTTFWQFYRLPKPVRVALRARGEHRDARCVRAVFNYWRLDPADIAEAVLYVDHKAWLEDYYRREYPELYEASLLCVYVDDEETVVKEWWT
jgi:hypothetical protein